MAQKKKKSNNSNNSKGSGTVVGSTNNSNNNTTKTKTPNKSSIKKSKKATSSSSASPSQQSSIDTKKASLSSVQIDRIYYIFAIIAFIAGIATPPLYQHYYDSSPVQVKVTPVTTSSTTTTKTKATKATKATTTNNEKNVKSKDYVECTQDQLSQFLHDEPIPGMHILCFPPKSSSSTTTTSDDTIKFYQQASNHTTHIVPIISSSSSSTTTFQEFKDALETKLHIEMYDKKTSMKQPWSIYTTNGEEIIHEFQTNNKDGNNNNNNNNAIIDTLQKHGMVILFEGGSWLWPGVRIGFQRTIQINDKNNHKSNVTLETLSIFPLVLSVQNFIDETECAHVQNKAKPKMQYSQVTLMDHDQDRPASDFRTSQSTFIDAVNDKIMERLEYRTASLTRIPRNHQEYTQVLRYGKHEKYSAHLDWFDRKMYLQDANTLDLIDNGRRNRLATVFWYLSDVEEGGQTAFPRFNKGYQPTNFDDCTEGLLVKPQRGKVIVFYSLTADGKGDPYSLHGACAVKEGIKWAANKWVWNTPMDFI